ncbi:MAG: aspartate-semialdehyde dehydrogenase [Bacteroidota bacterium]|nr:aspartate-semialdehyde dehydrogenase [Bacteroidota bacterium]
MRIAVVGATGLVGQKMLEVLSESKLPITEILLAASERSVGSSISYSGSDYTVLSLQQVLEAKPQVALLSAGGEVSKEWAAKYAEAGITVIDNSSTWRMIEGIPLIVPEVNANTLTDNDKIIANPNCSTIQLVVVLNALKQEFGLERVVVSTYQSITGTGVKAIHQMAAERRGDDAIDKVYPYTIDRNCIPHCDVFADDDYTKEELKVIQESRKILDEPGLRITCTAVRVPVVGGHSESVNVELSRDFEIEEIRNLLAATPGLVLQDDPDHNIYPMPITAHNTDLVYVGRIRRDLSQVNALNMWIVADNLRKGAATNAVQILKHLWENDLI